MSSFVEIRKIDTKNIPVEQTIDSSTVIDREYVSFFSNYTANEARPVWIKNLYGDVCELTNSVLGARGFIRMEDGDDTYHSYAVSRIKSLLNAYITYVHNDASVCGNCKKINYDFDPYQEEWLCPCGYLNHVWNYTDNPSDVEQGDTVVYDSPFREFTYINTEYLPHFVFSDNVSINRDSIIGIEFYDYGDDCNEGDYRNPVISLINKKGESFSFRPSQIGSYATIKTKGGNLFVPYKRWRLHEIIDWDNYGTRRAIIDEMKIIKKNLEYKIEQVDSSLSYKIVVIDTSVSILDSSMVTVNSNVNEMSSQVNKIDTSMSILDSSMSIMDSSVERMSSLIDKIDASVLIVDSSVERMASLVERMDSSMSSLDSSVAEMRTNIERTDSSVNNIVSDVEKIGQTVNTLDSSFSGFEMDINRMDSSIIEFNARIMDMDSSLKELDSSLSLLDSELSRLDSSITERFAMIDSSYMRLDSCIRDLDASISSRLDKIDASIEDISKKER